MDKQLTTIETVLKALADRTRLRILNLLCCRETCVCHIHESLCIPQPKASRHLAYLKRAGLVEDCRRGLWIHYRLADLDEDVRAVVLSALGALNRMPTAERDRQRLARQTEPSARAKPKPATRVGHQSAGNA